MKNTCNAYHIVAFVSQVVWWLWNMPQCWNCDSWHQCLFLRLTQCNPKHWCILPFCHVCIVQTQSDLLDMISSYNMDQFGQLISTIIVKSWPRKSEQSKDDIDETLHHMLTWPGIKHIFRFSGMSVCMPVRVVNMHRSLWKILCLATCNRPFAEQERNTQTFSAIEVRNGTKLRVFSLLMEGKG